MKKLVCCMVALLGIAVSLSAKKSPNPEELDSLGNKIKKGWNFGVLPSVAYDADYGFQGGILTNIYDYGDGKQYPEYIHSLYVEAAYTTKHHGIFRVNYDSKYLIPHHRLTLDATYLPDAMCDFYGFNGYQSRYQYDFHTWNKKIEKMNPDAYVSRVFYKYRRDLIRAAADLEGIIYKGLQWNAGLGVLGYIVQDCDINMLNGGSHKYDESLMPYDQKALNPNAGNLYDYYYQWGLIGKDEKHGGWHPYLRGGISYDTRDKRQGPNSGIYADAFFTFNGAFNTQTYGQQAAAGYNNIYFNFTFRHYVPCLPNRITFAYRVGTQNLVVGNSPFYSNNYMNTLFIQRVLYEGLGGGNSIRGMMCNRLQAKGFAFANVEFRFRLANFDIGRQHFFVGLNPFFDLGMVTQPYSIQELALQRTGKSLRENVEATYDYYGRALRYEDFFSDSTADIYRPHMTAGLGLKVGMNENFVLSVDWATAFDKQDSQKWANFYVKMGYLF